MTQYEALTGNHIELFLDRDDLKWGDHQHKKIDASLSDIAFFMPVLTPRYFKSAECRREIQFFARSARSLGIKQLIMPILYTDFAELHETEPDDELIPLVREFVWINWTDLKYKARDSEEYRRAVAAQAERLVEVEAELGKVDVVAAAEALERRVLGNDDGAGLIDQLASTEEAMPRWAETLNKIGEQITSIGELMTEATEDMHKSDQSGRGFAGRLAVSRRVAAELRDPVEKIEEFGAMFVSDLHEIDSGIRLVFERAPAEVEEDPSSLPAVCEFIGSIRALGAASHEGLAALRGMVESAAPLETMSRDLRNPIRRLRTGLTLMIEGQAVTDEWVAIADALGLECP